MPDDLGREPVTIVGDGLHSPYPTAAHVTRSRLHVQVFLSAWLERSGGCLPRDEVGTNERHNGRCADEQYCLQPCHGPTSRFYLLVGSYGSEVG